MTTRSEISTNTSPRFRHWAEGISQIVGIPVSHFQGEWECDFEGWTELREAVFRFLIEVPPHQWGAETCDLLLYALARDNEVELIAEEIAMAPGALLVLAKAAIPSAEVDAKWQIAEQLAQTATHLPEAESLLIILADDVNEYVRRRALLSLAKIGFRSVEDLADAAWATDDVYQRIAALTALRDVRSPRLDAFLERAEADERESLVNWAARIRRGEELYS